MNKYKLIGLTEYAKRHLTVEDLAELDDMIGCEIEQSDYNSFLDDEVMYNMPDGEITHSRFLIVEPI